MRHYHPNNPSLRHNLLVLASLMKQRTSIFSIFFGCRQNAHAQLSYALIKEFLLFNSEIPFFTLAGTQQEKPRTRALEYTSGPATSHVMRPINISISHLASHLIVASYYFAQPTHTPSSLALARGHIYHGFLDMNNAHIGPF